MAKKLFIADKRVKQVFDVLSGVLVGAFGVDLIRGATGANDLILNKILGLFNTKISLTFGDTKSLAVIGGVVFTLIGVYQLYDAMTR